MNPDEYKDLIKERLSDPKIWAHSILGPDRTLLYGYTCNRESWHVYLKDGLIHRYVYEYDGTLVTWEANESEFLPCLIPDKRVYPESTDFVFALRLARAGVPVPYRKFDLGRYEEARKLGPFQAKTYPSQ